MAKQGWDYGKRVELARTFKDMTQAELAKRAGVHYSLISKIEAGHRDNPTLETLRRLAEALGVTVEWLVKE